MILFLLALLALCLFVYDQRKRSYWARRGVKSVPSVPFFGHFLPVVLTTEYAGVIYRDMYRHFNKERYFGAYEFHRPVLVLRDTKLIQDVLVKDFSHFSDHPNWIFDSKTFVRNATLKLNGNLWRAIRYKFTPTFSASRMESAFNRIEKAAPLNLKEGEVEITGVFREYAADAIAAYFGATIGDKGAFLRHIRKQFEMPVLRYMELLIVEHFPKLAQLVGAQFVRTSLSVEYEKTMRDLIRGPSEFRTIFDGILADGVMELKAKDFDSSGKGDPVFQYDATEDLLMGQVVQFVLGALDTTSNTMAFMVYRLAKHPEVQAEARKQTIGVLEKHGNKWTYEAVRDLTYIQYCILETTRIHPVLPFLFRDVTKDYILDDGLPLKKGDKIVIPSSALQTDPEYYDEPDKFKPERWAGVSEARNNYTWLPFGDGPRQCLGMRFAMMEMRLAFAKMLVDFEFTLSEEQPDPPKLHPRTFLTQYEGPVYINCKKLPT